MSNRLINSGSPYLLQHADNPVDWYPWGEEALERARQENKPIFLSIGYAACHWCHVMAHESFEDPDTAAIMNEHFINIKVDREERPDLDNIYMKAVVAMTGQGGWPMSVFLTPEGKPFFGGTYFPPTPRYNMPSFRDLLLSIAKAWEESHDQLLQDSERINKHLQRDPAVGKPSGTINDQILEKAALSLAQAYDWKHGGWGDAPKFPQPMAIEFLLRQATRGDKMSRDMSIHALRAMAKGGMYDVVGGGFARYSVDERWLVPHFEKMLYDNAQLSRVYLHAYMVSGEETFRWVCEKTLDFVLREMSHPQGGFYSSLDADSEGEEGLFYVWTPEEIRAALDDPKDVELAMATYNITEMGNFEGRNVLQRALDDKQLAEKFDLPADQVPSRLEKIHEKLLKARSERVRPGTDDKVLVSWNAMMMTAFAEAGRYLDREDYTRVAIHNARFLLENLQSEDRLLRAWREGQAKHNAYLEDYAALILGLLALYQSDPDPEWFSSAKKLAVGMVSHYSDPQWGFFDTSDDHEQLITRPKELQDNATPSGNALAAEGLLQLSAYIGRHEWRDQAEEMLVALQETLSRYPTAFARWLCAMDFALGPTHEVAILGEPDNPLTQDLIETLWSVFRPRVAAAISEYPPPQSSPSLLDDRPLKNNQPTAYVCQGFVCLSPVNTPEEFNSQLEESS